MEEQTTFETIGGIALQYPLQNFAWYSVGERVWEREMKDVVESVSPPKKQYDETKRLFLGEKLRRCQEWVSGVLLVIKEQGVSTV